MYPKDKNSGTFTEDGDYVPPAKSNGINSFVNVQMHLSKPKTGDDENEVITDIIEESMYREDSDEEND